MSNRLQSLEAVKEELKPFLPQYLTMRGVRINPGRNFNCISPSHDDRDPSMGLVRGNTNIFHCFGCGIKGDIFLAAHLLENKPLTGKAFIVENLKYLAEQFGVDVPDVQLSEEELYELEVKHAYAHASGILTSSRVSEMVSAKVAEMGWKPETLSALGIGSVESFENYFERMTKQYGYEAKFLESIDLANKALFSPNNLIFTVCDEAGAPVGFAARRLTYAEDKARYEKIVAEIQANNPDPNRRDAALRSQVKPSKYVNTSTHNKFYDKLRRLFGFHLAKKHTPPLFVMEGYPDAATARDRGLLNVAAIGSTAFTKEHVEVILNCGIKHIIIVLDGDKAGYQGTDRAVKIIEEAVGDRVGLKVELIQMPEGSDDPDRYIRLYGVDEFLKLPRYDIFSWKVKRAMDGGNDPIALANEAVPLIVMDQNYLNRLAKIKKIAQVTGVDEEFLKLEVKRHVDQDVMRMREEKSIAARKAADLLKHNPDSAGEVARQLLSQIETIDKRKDGYDPKNILEDMRRTFTQQQEHKRDVDLRTGWELFDKYMGGIPMGAAFLSGPGKPNQGKTSMFSNLAWRLPEYNPEAIIVIHTMDDSNRKFIPRILGSKYNLPSNLFKKAGYYLEKPDGKQFIADHYPEFPEIYFEAQTWLEHMVSEERLLVLDANRLESSLPAAEIFLKQIRQRHPDQPIVWMADNFAQYQLEVNAESDAVRARQKSMFIKRIANEQDACLYTTCELTKDALKPGVRPRMGKIIGTQGVAYDADCNLGVYNDLKDRSDAADIVWQDPNDLVRVNADGVEQMAPKRKPVLEIVIDKNKITEFDGAIYYRFDPATARLDECDEAEQAVYRGRAEKINSKTVAAEINGSHAPYKNQF